MRLGEANHGDQLTQARHADDTEGGARLSMGPRLVAAAAAAALATAFVPSTSPNWGTAAASLAPSTGDGSGASGDIGSMME